MNALPANNRHIYGVKPHLDCVYWLNLNNVHTDKIRFHRGKLGGGPVRATVKTHHDNASRLFNSAHAHNGCHANGGALEVNPAAKDIGQNKCVREDKWQTR